MSGDDPDESLKHLADLNERLRRLEEIESRLISLRSASVGGLPQLPNQADLSLSLEATEHGGEQWRAHGSVAASSQSHAVGRQGYRPGDPQGSLASAESTPSAELLRNMVREEIVSALNAPNRGEYSTLAAVLNATYRLAPATCGCCPQHAYALRRISKSRLGGGDRKSVV